MRRTLALVVALGLLTLARPIRADAPGASASSTTPRTALEVSLRAGASLGLSFRADPVSNEAADLGAGAGLGLLLRTPYFLAPELDVAYAMLFRGRGLTPAESTSGAIDACSLSFGPAIDVTPWLRLHGGVALSWIFVRTSVAGDRASTSSLQLGYSFGITSLFMSSGRLRAGIDLRMSLVAEASMMNVTLGVTGTFDAITARERPDPAPLERTSPPP